jgi:CRP-like cAMP-binding protein
MTLDDVLAGTYLFCGERDRIARFAERFRRRRYPRGTYVFRAGDVPTHVFVIVTGVLKGTQTASDGDEIVDVMLWGRGEVTGEPAVVIEGARRQLDVLAVEDSDLLMIARDDFLSMLEEDSVIMRRVLEHLATMIRARSALLSQVAFLDTAARVARRLLDLAATHGHQERGAIRLGIRVSQRDLAGMVLASRESVNRALATLVAEGAVSQQSGVIVIEQPSLLERRAQLADRVL